MKREERGGITPGVSSRGGGRMAKPKAQESEFPFAAADVAAQLVRWLSHLGAERRMSALTVEAYRGDLARFLAFLAEHLGRPPSLAALARVEVRDVRAFMSARRAEGISSRSLMRAPPAASGDAWRRSER